MGDYIQNLMYVCFAGFDYGFDTPMLLVSAGAFLLGGAAQCFLLFRKKPAWLPLLCAAAAVVPSALLYWAVTRVPVSLSQGVSDFIVYAAIAAVYSLPGILLGWLAYLILSKCRTSA